ncbi:hypothetical protein [Escherichia coli]|uniref:hypothetical protein n=1 Tax=Escherichia coli TaxID=562 RepID=UPI000BE961AC|nr:hypothetical protein [Escherichia coli]
MAGVGINLFGLKKKKITEKEKKKKKRVLFAPRIFFYPPAGGGALETKKALCGFHTRTGQREVVFFPAYEPE